jgi:CHAD domain-containing protein
MTQKPDKGTCVYGASVLSRHLQALQGEEEGIRQAQDIEYVHRMRVATRRLRSALPLFADCYPQKRVRDWTEQIKLITKALGEARDADVQIEALQTAAADLTDPGFKPGLRRLNLRLRQKRASLQEGVIQALDKFVESGVSEEMERRLAPFLARLDETYLYSPDLYQRGFTAINADLRAFLAYEPFVNRPECVSELHAMRIAAKHLRYTMEAFAPIYPAELKTHLQVVRKLQEQLGDIHDYDVWGVFLPEFLEKERGLTLKFFGHLRGFPKIETGIQAFLEHQRLKRGQVYEEFTITWEKISQEEVWKDLQGTIQAPFFQAGPAQAKPTPPGPAL